MDLNFEIFMVALLVLSILVVGNFLRDGESNWLEGALLVVSVLAQGVWDSATQCGHELIRSSGCLHRRCHRVVVLSEPRRGYFQ